MNMHKHARLTPRGRALLVERILAGMPVADAAQAAGVSTRTAYKWLKRYREEGLAGLADRSSRPHACPRATPPGLIEQMVEYRRLRLTYRHIAERLGCPLSTVARCLRRRGCARLGELEPAAPPTRYEYPQPGDLLHLDIKKLGRFHQPGHRVTADPTRRSRGSGWEYVHVAIDDASRVAFSCVKPDETARSTCHALIEALRYYRHFGIRFTRLMTDNGPAYRSRTFRRLLRRLRLRHLYTRPYTPRTNGKAERFIQTALREWAYARAYDSSEQRAEALPLFMHHYNWHRPHASLGYQPPISRVPLPMNNLMALHN